MNGEYLRRMDPEKYLELVRPYIDQAVKKPYDRALLAGVLKERVSLLNEIPEMLDFIDELPDYDTSLYINKKMKTDEAIALDSLKASLEVLEGLEEWNHDAIYNALVGLAQKMEVKNGKVLYPVRVALSGKAFTPGGAIELALIFGKEETLNRIRKGIEKLSA